MRKAVGQRFARLRRDEFGERIVEQLDGGSDAASNAVNFRFRRQDLARGQPRLQGAIAPHCVSATVGAAAASAQEF